MFRWYDNEVGKEFKDGIHQIWNEIRFIVTREGLNRGKREFFTLKSESVLQSIAEQ